MGFWECALEGVGIIMNSKDILTFFEGKKVLITGHTGFKGSWLSAILLKAGAQVTGYSKGVPTNPGLFQLLQLDKKMNSVEGDIRNLDELNMVFTKTRPEIVFHLAAQPIVRISYRNPVDTYGTNVMGTVNVCECIRKCESVRSFLNVTTDKVYDNKEWEWGYREEDPLDGYDPYSNSKSCSELVTHSYVRSYFRDREIAASTARAGNVIGGGDFSVDRIIPDCVRAALKKEFIVVRNPYSVRPYQHVLEPLFAYLMIAQRQYENPTCMGCYNVGPEDVDCITTGELVELFCQKWGEGLSWENNAEDDLHEAGFLKLDCSRIKSVFGWQPVWRIEEAVTKTVEWVKIYAEDGDIMGCIDWQTEQYLQEFQYAGGRKKRNV